MSLSLCMYISIYKQTHTTHTHTYTQRGTQRETSLPTGSKLHGLPVEFFLIFFFKKVCILVTAQHKCTGTLTFENFSLVQLWKQLGTREYVRLVLFMVLHALHFNFYLGTFIQQISDVYLRSGGGGGGSVYGVGGQTKFREAGGRSRQDSAH